MNDFRLQIASDLLASGHIGAYSDYTRIADALERGKDWSDILDMAELERWPDALKWLHAVSCGDDDGECDSGEEGADRDHADPDDADRAEFLRMRMAKMANVESR